MERLNAFLIMNEKTVPIDTPFVILVSYFAIHCFVRSNVGIKPTTLIWDLIGQRLRASNLSFGQAVA